MFMKGRGLAVLLIGAALVLALLVACAGEAEEETPTPTVAGMETPAVVEETPGVATPTVAAPAAAKPLYGGTLRWAASADPVHWDVHQTISYTLMTVISPVYDKLLTFPFGPEYDPSDLTPIGEMAESWEIPDDLTLVFHLHKGIKYHDKPPANGREMTSEDVKWTFDRMIRMNAGQRYMLDEVESIECPDKYTVIFNLKKPFAPLFSHLADAFAWIICPEVEEEYGDYKKWESAIGTGPWMLDTYQPNVGMWYSRNPDYYMMDEEGNRLPYIDKIHWLIIPDASTRLAAFRSGDLDWLLGIERLEQPSVMETNPELVWTKDWVAVGQSYIYWDVTKPPFDDVRVRRAVALSIDREAMVEARCLGFGDLLNGPIPTAFKDWHLPLEELGPAAEWYEHDIDKAKQLLAEAGYPDGFKTTLNSTTVYGTTHVENVELMKDFLSTIGIDAEIQMKEYAGYLTTTFVGKIDGLAYGPQTTFMQVDSWLYEMYHTNGSRNQISLSNPELDKLLETQRGIYDYEKRKPVVDEAQKLIADQVYRVPTITCFGRGAWHPWVQNAAPKMGGYDYGTRWRRLWLDETSPTR